MTDRATMPYYTDDGYLIRHCLICDREINLCNGIVLSCDLVPAMEHKIAAREFCFDCATKYPAHVKNFYARHTEPIPRTEAPYWGDAQ